MEKHAKKYFIEKYKELKENIFYIENKEILNKEINGLHFGKYHQGPVSLVNLDFFLPIIDSFFKEYYNYDGFIDLIDKQIFIYDRKELIDYINAYYEEDYKSIITSRITLSLATSYLLLNSKGFYICPYDGNDFSIYISNEGDLCSVFDLVHEFTHKIHYDLSLSYGDEIWEIVSESLASYNEYIFSLYLKNKVSNYDIDLVIEHTDQNKETEIYYRKILQNIFEKKQKPKLTESEKETLLEYYEENYFPLNDFSHQLGYVLYKNYLSRDKDMSIEDRSKKISESMKDNTKDLKKILAISKH